MKIFVTGGTGFLGQHVLKKLISDGHDVRALTRSLKNAALVKKMGATPVPGSLDKIVDFVVALKDVDVVIHCTAPVEFWGPWEKYQRGIINATMELAEESARLKIKRFIHISSESVLQDTEDLIDIDETHPYPKLPNSFYGEAKKIAEEHLLKLNSRMEILILRPTFIWGPNAPAFETLKEKVKSGKFVWIDEGRASFEAVHVENVAYAVSLAITKGSDRQIYFVTDDEKGSVREFLGSLFQALNLPIPEKSMPGKLARVVAKLTESLWKKLRISGNPPLTRFDLAFVAMPRSYRIDRIKNELGYHPVVSRQVGFQKIKEGLTN